MVAHRYGMADMLSPALMVWFFVFLVLAVLIYGSLFIAVGAAAGDVKDTQTLLLPVMIIACLPLFALGPIMQRSERADRGCVLVVPIRHALPSGCPTVSPAGCPAIQMVCGIARGPGDDGRLRLGRRADLPRRSTDAGQGCEVRRPAELGAKGLRARHTRAL